MARSIPCVRYTHGSSRRPSACTMRRWGVNFTPTIFYFVPPAVAIVGKDGGAAAAWKLIGYWKPFHFLSTFVYVHERAYKQPGGFQRWLGERADKLRAEGKDVRLW